MFADFHGSNLKFVSNHIHSILFDSDLSWASVCMYIYWVWTIVYCVVINYATLFIVYRCKDLLNWINLTLFWWIISVITYLIVPICFWIQKKVGSAAGKNCTLIRRWSRMFICPCFISSICEYFSTMTEILILTK